MDLSGALAECPIVAILRAPAADRFADVAETLVGAGIRAVEFTFTTPGVAEAISAYAERKPDFVALGAGTVTTPSQARAAVEAGATYLVSPDTNVEVISEAKRLGVPMIADAFTPTEILTAWRAGATMVKVFPISVGGTSYLRALRGPLPDVPLVPTGGVDIANAGAYLAAGATAVGVGKPLVENACEPDASLDALADRARILVGSVRGRR